MLTKRWSWARGAATALLLLLTACGKQEEQRRSSPGPLSLDDLRHAEYTSPYAQEGIIRLSAGEYREKYSDEWATELVVRLTRHVAFRRNDTLDAAAAVLESAPGGGGFMDLALVVKHGDSVRNTSTRFLGDRVKIDTLYFDGPALRVRMLVHRREDPMCCPTQRVQRTFLLAGDSLSEQPVSPEQVTDAKHNR